MSHQSTDKTTLFVCHTPLHLMLSGMVISGSHLDADVIVVNDAPGMHAVSKVLLSESRLHFMEGAANAGNFLERTLIRVKNFRRIMRLKNGARGVFVFNDRLPEGQAALLSARSGPCICMEDGTALYAISASKRESPRKRLWNRVAFGPRWKQLERIGTHPLLSEIWCFFPDLLHDDIRLPAKKLSPFNPWPNLAHDFDLPEHGSYLVAACPFTGITPAGMNKRILNKIQKYCDAHGLEPLFKIHPRDEKARALIDETNSCARYLPTQIPLELAIMGTDTIHAVAGYKSSVLHICKALRPAMECLYVEDDGVPETNEWKSFYSATGVLPLEPAIPEVPPA